MDQKASQPSIIDWEPVELLLGKGNNASQFALLVLNQPIENPYLLKLMWEKARFRIAADGGGNRLRDAFRDPPLLGLAERVGLEVICGDLDSLEPTAELWAMDRGTKIVQVDDQNSTDFTKCVEYLRNIVKPFHYGVLNIVCFGGLGGRVDHGMSQLHQLYKEQQDPEYKDGRVYLLSTESITFILKSGTHRIQVRDSRYPTVLGIHVGIIPVKEAAIITTSGLKWDVTNWLTEFGGQISTSNEVREDLVIISTIGDVLFTIEVDYWPNHST